MRLLLTAFGSYGDVFPMVGLGAAMHARGHRVAIITNPHFRSVVEDANLELISLGTEQEYDELTKHPDLWHPLRGPLFVMKHAMVGLLRETYRLISSHYVAGETVLGAHLLDLASRCFQEKHGAPLASIPLAPVALRSLVAPPRMFGMFQPRWMPRLLTAMQFWLGDRCFIDRLLEPELNAFRSELGLLNIHRPLQSWYLSPQLVLGLFPDWFAPQQPDWPEATSLVGFPLWDQQAAKVPLSNSAKQFFDEGEAPLVFAPGSAMTQGKAFFESAIEACRRMRRRGMLMTKYPDQLPSQLPAGVRHFQFEPFSLLLPRAAALVHHGGIGTTAQGLTAGLPHLVMPMAYDQLDNATRLQRLGVGRILLRRHFLGPAVARELDALLTSATVQTQCDRWKQKCDGDASLARACEQLEQLAEKKKL